MTVRICFLTWHDVSPNEGESIMNKFFFSVVVALVVAQTVVAQYKSPTPPSWMTKPSVGKAVPSNGPFIGPSILDPERDRQSRIRSTLSAKKAWNKGVMDYRLRFRKKYAEIIVLLEQKKLDVRRYNHYFLAHWTGNMEAQRLRTLIYNLDQQVDALIIRVWAELDDMEAEIVAEVEILCPEVRWEKTPREKGGWLPSGGNMGNAWGVRGSVMVYRAFCLSIDNNVLLW